MQHSTGQRVDRGNRFTIEQMRKRRADAQQTNQALRATGSRQQANASLGER
ncbi:hypothetical protein D3C85_1721570 [compost metagenome]